MKIGDEPSFVDGVSVHDQLVEMVKEFSYLGSTISNDDEVYSDVRIKIAKAAKVFGFSIFTNHHLSVNVKHAIYKAVVFATLFYDSECWAVKANQLHHLEVFHHHYVRCILGISISSGLGSYITNDMLL